VCPTEIAAFGKPDRDFQDRQAPILGGSTDSEFVAPRLAHTPSRSQPRYEADPVMRGCNPQEGLRVLDAL